MEGTRDKYDQAYWSGFEDGAEGLPKRPPDDDSEVNYRDGYEDGRFAKQQEDS